MNLFIIPGNPPASYFYEEWKKEWLTTYPQHKFHISLYPDVEIKQNSQQFLSNLLEAHTKAFLEYYEEVNVPIVIIGHSLGSYFAQAISQTHPGCVQKCIFIHPFLRKPERRAELFLHTLRFARKWNGFEKLLLKNKDRLEKINPDFKHVTSAEAVISLKLAYHETKTIMRDKSQIEIPVQYQKKFHFYYTQNDRWCTPKVIHQLKNQIASKEVTAAHDFVRLKSDREVMTKHLYELLDLDVT